MTAWFRRGMPVCLADGKRLGRIEEISHAGDFLHVQSGRVLVRDWYVPTRAIAALDENSVRLSVSRHDLVHEGWNVPPVEYLVQQGSTVGYEYAETVTAGTHPGAERPEGNAN